MVLSHFERFVPRPAPSVGSALALAMLLLPGCAPDGDWRELRPGAAGLRVSFPCRPDKQVRSVPLAGPPVALTLYVCQHAGLTFAISHADVVDPARIGPALQALHDAARANLGAAGEPALKGGVVPGATPQPAAGRWLLHGHLPGGAPQQAALAVFSRGTHVVQATVLGAAIDERAVQRFFDGLRFAD